MVPGRVKAAMGFQRSWSLATPRSLPSSHEVPASVQSPDQGWP
jgi:hypothetical protein